MKLSSPRSLLTLLLLAWLGSLIAGCATPPPPAPGKPTRVEALSALGFEKTDEGYVLNLPGPLLFDTGSDVLSDGAKVMLAKLAVDLKTLDINKLRLFGHTDNVGSADMNRSLSAKRAEAVAVAMAANGFANENLERRGFGFDRPIAGNDTPEGRARNRRVAVIVPFE
ncbi:MAG: OmpA family protein [Burkholderiales bacterium]|nr:OmpA family protein [Burkholderiales bacterium]